MRVAKHALARLAASLAISATAVTAHAADDGLITKPSRHSVKETVTRFETAVKEREAAGFTVFTEIDHAAAAKKFGLDMAVGRARAAAAIAVRARQPSDPTGRSRGTLLLEQLSN